MPFDPDSFLADILEKVDVDKRQAVEEALRNQTVASALDAGFRRQDDYSRKMDELKQTRTEAEAQFNQDKGALEAEKARLAEWYKTANEDYQRSQEMVKRYRAEFGDLEGNEPGQQTQPRPEGLTREEHENLLREALDDHSRKAIQFADVLTDLKLEHRQRFDERLDTEALFKHQAETRMPLDAAYKDFVAERVAKAQEEKFQKQLEQAKEEGIREGRSQAQMPVRPDQPNAIMQALEKPTTSEDRAAAAAAAWRQAQTA